MNKRKEQAKGFIAGVLIMILLSSTALVAANTITKDVTITFRDIRVVVNGEQVTPKDAAGNILEPFLWNGTTYLPIRAIADIFDLNANWDRDTSTIYLEDRYQEIPTIVQYLEPGLRMEARYDAYGRETMMTILQVISYCEFVYDIHGNVTRYSFDENGLLIWSEERDARGWFIRKTVYDEVGLVDYWYEYVFDDNNMSMKTIFFNSDGSIREWITDEYIGYNEDGYLVARLTRYCADGVEQEVWYNMRQSNP